MSTAKQVPTGQATPEVTPEATLATVVAFPEGVAEATKPVFDWWLHHWMDATHPMVRIQLAWMESLLEAVQVEAEFMAACAASNQKVSKCFSDPETLRSPASLSHCYHEAAKDMADAHMARLGKVAELPKDFRQRLWEEIC
ncbi:hypothetical protein MKP05_10855 [Halomonas sp. EGI 63088]|uniref:Phasin domain-containing protein n=1 Tax=Halomonas flagellata TaxID=2920385 RepID=A0ABS9RUT5_9GAMM|nr:hypothetical protein [Halomonas flagellata]MCH4563628.1 hypothetical protein [Halomonas flagellata]